LRQFNGRRLRSQPDLYRLINDLYKNEWSQFNNFFCPTLKLKEKQKLNSKYIKKYESPQTPYQRLAASSDIVEEAKLKLVTLYNSLNPFTLKKTIETKLKTIFHIVRLPTT